MPNSGCGGKSVLEPYVEGGILRAKMDRRIPRTKVQAIVDEALCDCPKKHGYIWQGRKYWTLH